jgi:mannose-1-phosphate guanylyltransferase/mannose-6-phosphate isomerase
MKVIPIILTGGFGKRLWPISRSNSPKQLSNLVGKRSMLQLTANRIKEVKNLSNDLILICNEEYKFSVDRQLKEIGIDNPTILVEPGSRNTAPAAFVASLQATKINKSEESLLLIMPSDHLIEDTDSFVETIDEASKVAMEGKLVTLGIQPTGPSTNYGYIKVLENIDFNKTFYSVEAFIEKPEAKLAEEFIDDGNFLWNSGIFLFRADTFQDEMKKYNKELSNYGSLSLERAKLQNNFIQLDSDSFLKSQDISIDYALMEKTNNAFMVPLKSDWNDLGNWSALYDISFKDKKENVLLGDIIAEDTHNSYLSSSSRLIATLGLENIVVVDTPDVTFISTRDKVGDIKKIYNRLLDEGRSEKDLHRKVIRPWGWYDSLEKGKNFQVKRIGIFPGSSISLQKHTHRSEHWIAIKGKGKVTINNENFDIERNQSTYIEKQDIHRLENTGKEDLEIIEVQIGDYLGEDDILRFDDLYGRVEDKEE